MTQVRGTVGFGAARHGEMVIPRDYGLPHEIFRGGQHTAIEFCRNLTGTGIAEGETGSGKTSWAAATANGFKGEGRRKVTALVKTKNLQATNYGAGYNFDVLYGKSNYFCAHPNIPSGIKCDECLFHDEGMSECPYKFKCPYVRQRNLVRQSKRAALNYAYWMYSKWPRERYFSPDVLFCDEAHELSDFIIGHVGITFTEAERCEWNLTRFPVINDMSTEWQIMNRITIRPVPDAIAWLSESVLILRQKYAELGKIIKDNPSDSKSRKAIRKCELLGKKVTATLTAIQTHPDDWYIKSGRRARNYRGNKVPGFVCKPLTARHHAPSYFISDHWNTIMMSATIGDPVAFTEELGITDYTYHQVPSEWSPDTRPIEVLDAPAMSRKNTLKHPGAFDKQADVIAEAIHNCDETWSGLVLVTRKSEGKLLAERLARRGLEDRVWVTPGDDGSYVPTDHQVNAWHERLRKIPNSICLSWSLWTGYDGLDEKILIAAKSPAPFLGDGFEKARLDYSHRFYNWRTGCTLAQGLGRIRRGRECDYNINGNVNKRVFIADKSWRRIKKSLPEWLRKAIV